MSHFRMIYEGTAYAPEITSSIRASRRSTA